MKIKRLRERVKRAEAIVARHGHSTHAQWSALRTTLKAGWTPLRIILAGFGLGFVIGQTKPQAALGSLPGKLNATQRFLEIVSTLTAIFRTFRPTTSPDVSSSTTTPMDTENG